MNTYFLSFSLEKEILTPFCCLTVVCLTFFVAELSKETNERKDEAILALESRLWAQSKELDEARVARDEATHQMTTLRADLGEGVLERGQLEERVAALRQELEAEKEEHSNVLAKLNALEESCRSDRKYRDLKEEISTYQKEVDSLNVVLEMKNKRNRSAEQELMMIKLELSNYESLKESFKNLQRENEPLTETVGMKARKNAEQTREIDNLRSTVKKEANERKRMSIRTDQLEYRLNETLELLHTVSMGEMVPIADNDEEDEGEEADKHESGQESEKGSHNTMMGKFSPRFYSSVNMVSAKANGGGMGVAHSSRSGGRNVRRLFSSPGGFVTGGALASSGAAAASGDGGQRQHFQHQEPNMSRTAASPRAALPDMVLSSIGSSSNNWPSSSSSSTRTADTVADGHNGNGHNHHHHHHNYHTDFFGTHSNKSTNSRNSSANSSPLNSPKVACKQASSRKNSTSSSTSSEQVATVASTTIE